MGIEIIFKLAAVGILTSVVGQILKHIGKDEIAMLTTLAGRIVALLMVLDMITNIFDSVKNMFNL